MRGRCVQNACVGVVKVDVVLMLIVVLVVLEYTPRVVLCVCIPHHAMIILGSALLSACLRGSDLDMD